MQLSSLSALLPYLPHTFVNNAITPLFKGNFINLPVPIKSKNHQAENCKGLIFITHQQSCRNVMFSQVSVCLSIGRSPCHHYPWYIGPHCSGTPQKWDIMGSPPPDMEPPACDIFVAIPSDLYILMFLWSAKKESCLCVPCFISC